MKNKLQNIIHSLPVIILFAYIFLNIISFWSAEKRELINIFEDDSYYYFKIAKNFVEYSRFTFDGHTLANGFHPLWMLFILPLSYAIRDPFVFLRTLGIVSSILMGAITFVAFRYAQRRYSLLSYSIAASLTLFCVINFGMTGMEATILIPLAVTSLLLLIRLAPWNALSPNQHSDKNWFILGVVLSFVQLARLDAILFNITVLALIALSDQSSHKWKHLVIMVVPIFSTGITYLLVNYFMFQNFVPTSGLVKSMNRSAINHRFIEQMLTPGWEMWNIYLGMIFIALGYVIYFIITKQHKREISANKDGHHIALIISVFFLLYTGYQLFSTSWILWRWYGYPIYLMGIFVLPLIFELLLTRLRARPNLHTPIYIINNIAGTLIISLMAITGIRYGYWRNPLNLLFAYDNYLIADELNEKFQAPVIFAMGDRAGSFAYFFKGDVLQLEGLVGEYSIIKAIQNNTLMEYMTEFGVEYVIAYATPPENYTEWTFVTPWSMLSAGPYAEIRVCKKTEVLWRATKHEPIYVWKWPSCDL